MTIESDLLSWYSKQTGAVKKHFLKEELADTVYNWYSGLYMNTEASGPMQYVRASPFQSWDTLEAVFRFMLVFSPASIPKEAYRVQLAKGGLHQDEAIRTGVSFLRNASAKTGKPIQSWSKSKKGISKFMTSTPGKGIVMELTDEDARLYLYKTHPSERQVLGDTVSIVSFLKAYGLVVDRLNPKSPAAKYTRFALELILKDPIIRGQDEVILSTPSFFQADVGVVSPDRYMDRSYLANARQQFKVALDRL